MANEPHDDREFSAEVELFTGQALSLLGGAKLKEAFQRRWDRPNRYFDSVVNNSGLTRGELDDRIARADRITDLFITAGQRASEQGDREYSDVLSRLVAAALIDDAKIDPISYLMDRIVQLDPLHLRILETIRAGEIGDREMMEATKPAVRSEHINAYQHAEIDKNITPIACRHRPQAESLTAANRDRLADLTPRTVG